MCVCVCIIIIYIYMYYYNIYIYIYIYNIYNIYCTGLSQDSSAYTPYLVSDSTTDMWESFSEGRSVPLVHNLPAHTNQHRATPIFFSLVGTCASDNLNVSSQCHFVSSQSPRGYRRLSLPGDPFSATEFQCTSPRVEELDSLHTSAAYEQPYFARILCS